MTLERIDQLRQLTLRLLAFAGGDPLLASAPDLEALAHHEANLGARRYAVAVIAAMKAGKSTFFNACLGRDLLPHETNACTTAITRVKHASAPLDVVRKVHADGHASELRAAPGQSLEEAFHADVRASRKSGAIGDIAYYYTESPIAALAGLPHDDLVQNFELIDTPGPNEASTLELDAQLLQRTALQQLREADALVILLDFTNWQTEVNERLLKALFANRVDLQQEAEKIFFVLNKIDEHHGKDEPLEDTLAKVAALIRHHAPAIAKPQVLAVSARQGFLGRMLQGGQATDAHRQLAEEKYAARYPQELMIDGRPRRVLPTAEELAPALLADSRLAQVEGAILEDVFRRAGGDLLVQARRGVRAALGNLASLVETQRAATSATLEELTGQVEEAKATLAAIRADDGALKAIPAQHFAELAAALAEVTAEARARCERALDEVLPAGARPTSRDRAELEARHAQYRREAELALALQLNHLDDESRRRCGAAQHAIDRALAEGFDELSVRAARVISQHLRFQPQAFQLKPFTPVPTGLGTPEIERSGGSAATSEDFGVQARRTAGYVAAGATAGAALGSVVPVLGNALGAALGGIAGALVGIFGGGASEPDAPSMYTLDLAPLRDELVDVATRLVEDFKRTVDERLAALAREYVGYLERQLAVYVAQLEAQLNHTLTEAQAHQADRAAHERALAQVGARLDELGRELDALGVEDRPFWGAMDAGYRQHGQAIRAELVGTDGSLMDGLEELRT